MGPLRDLKRDQESNVADDFLFKNIQILSTICNHSSLTFQIFFQENVSNNVMMITEATFCKSNTEIFCLLCFRKRWCFGCLPSKNSWSADVWDTCVFTTRFLNNWFTVSFDNTSEWCKNCMHHKQKFLLPSGGMPGDFPQILAMNPMIWAGEDWDSYAHESINENQITMG